MIDEEKSKVYLKSSSVWDRFRLMFVFYLLPPLRQALTPAQTQLERISYSMLKKEKEG